MDNHNMPCPLSIDYLFSAVVEQTLFFLTCQAVVARASYLVENAVYLFLFSLAAGVVVPVALASSVRLKTKIARACGRLVE